MPFLTSCVTGKPIYALAVERDLTPDSMYLRAEMLREERGLARPIRSDERDYLPLGHVQADAFRAPGPYRS